MYNIKLIIAYDGTGYLGWQKTRIGPSIEAVLQQTCEQILQHPVALQAASRTDAGVHARGQVVNLLTSKSHLDVNKFHASLNCLLPKSIIALQTEHAPDSFHPTLDCNGKEYRYFVCPGPVQLPHNRLFSWHVPYKLDLERMKNALPILIGKHDFGAFSKLKKDEPVKNTIREIQSLDFFEIEDQRLCFRIRGNHFLYKMVRTIVGTLIDIGKGKIALHELSRILHSRSRPFAGVTAPAQGLFLNKVFYL